MRYLLCGLFFFCAIPFMLSQNVETEKNHLRSLEVNLIYKTELGFNYYDFKHDGAGVFIQFDESLIKKNKFKLSLGLFNALTIGSAAGLIEGDYGVLSNNSLGLSLNAIFQLKEQAKWYGIFSPYLSWDWIKINGGIRNNTLSINQIVKGNTHHLGRGFILKLGRKLNEKMAIQLILGADITRLTDKGKVLEYPYFSYGIGFKKTFQNTNTE